MRSPSAHGEHWPLEALFNVLLTQYQLPAQEEDLHSRSDQEVSNRWWDVQIANVFPLKIAVPNTMQCRTPCN